jgi:hypothetical protein
MIAITISMHPDRPVTPDAASVIYAARANDRARMIYDQKG